MDFFLLFFSRRANGGILYLDFLSSSFFFLYNFHERLKSFDQMVLSVDPNGSRYTAGIDRVIETRMFPVVRQGRKLLACFLRKIHTVINRAEASKQHCQREQIRLERVGRINIHH